MRTMGLNGIKTKKIYVALGNAEAISGGLSLKSEKIEAYYTETKDSSMDINKVYARKM